MAWPRPEQHPLSWWLLRISLFITLSLFTLSYPCSAQTTPGVNSSDANFASLFENRLREDFDKKKDFREERERQVEKPKVAPEKKDVPDLSFFIRKVELRGNEFITSEQLTPIIRPYENKEWTLKELHGLADLITQKYQELGLITSLAYVPPQEVKDGVLTLQVVEGKVGDQMVAGEKYSRAKHVRRYSTIDRGDVLQLQTIQQSLGYMNENPDRYVTATLQAGELPETSDIIFEVEDKFPAHVSYSFDNQGGKTSGRQRSTFTVTHNNLTGFDDSLSVGTLFGTDFGFFFLQNIFPIPHTKTKIINGFTHGQVAPKKAVEDLGINALSQSFYTRIDQSLIQNETIQLNLEGGLTFRDNRTRLLSASFQRERLRILEAGPRIRINDRFGSTHVRSNFLFGMNALGAGTHADPGARQGVEPQFFQMTGSVTRLQPLPFEMFSKISFNFQHSASKVPSQQAFYIGGAESVRGYPEADYVADSGFYSQIELNVPIYVIPKSLEVPYLNQSLRDTVSLVGFFDQGAGHFRGATPFDESNRYLASLGGGVNVNVSKHFYAKVAWARALGDNPLTGEDRSRFHFQLTTEV